MGVRNREKLSIRILLRTQIHDVYCKESGRRSRAEAAFPSLPITVKNQPNPGILTAQPWVISIHNVVSALILPR